MVLTLMASCGRPASLEQFHGAGESMPWCYDYMQLNSEQVTDVELLLKIDAKEKVDSIPLTLSWISPSTKVYDEDFVLPIGVSAKETADVKFKYRTNVKLPETGNWHVLISMPDSLLEKGVCGVGLIQVLREDGSR